MEDFVVSARKYRPDTFDTVVGQEAITTTLKNSIRNGHLAQSFLFCGPRGVGKTTCARILARTINCMNPGADLEPCGECESCRGFKNNASQNIYELDAASNRSVESMRTLVEQVRIPPQVGKYKVYIIDEVHMLTSEAFNAFLKTLEEPPAYAKFILATTEKNKIIPTILSRCQIFDFKRIRVEDIVAHLQRICEKENIRSEEEALRVIAQKADGGLRDALSMFDQIVSFSGNSITYQQVISMLNILDYETYFEMFGYFLAGNVPAALDLFNRILENGFDGQVFVGGLSRHLRSLLLMQDVQTVALLESSETLRTRYREQTVRCTLAQLLEALELCSQCDLQYRGSNNKRLSVEILLLQLVRVFAPAALGARGGEAPASRPGESAGQAFAESDRKDTERLQGVSASGDPIPSGVREQKSGPAMEARSSNAPVAAADTVAPVSERAVTQTVTQTENRDSLPEVGAPVQHATDTPAPATVPEKSDPVAVAPVVAGTPPPGRSTFSLRALFDTVQSEEKPETESAAAVSAETENAPFTQEELQLAWKLYLREIEKNKPLLFAILDKAAPKLQENYGITLHVENRFTGDELAQNQKPVLDFLRSELHNKDIHFIISVDESIRPGVKIYTPQEKYAEMQRNNPELKNFRDSLNLDLEL